MDGGLGDMDVTVTPDPSDSSTLPGTEVRVTLERTVVSARSESSSIGPK